MKCPNKKSQQYKELLEIANGNELIANHMWYTLDKLKQEGYITKNRFKAGNKFAYTVPKIEDNNSLSKDPFAKSKNFKTKNKLEQLLEDNMIDWIDVVETNKAFVIKLSIPELDLPITKNEPIVDLEEVLEKLDDYQLSEQALKEQELAEDKERKLVNKKERVSVKPGVEELFESNPELANGIYEVLDKKSKNEFYNRGLTFNENSLKSLNNYFKLNLNTDLLEAGIEFSNEKFNIIFEILDREYIDKTVDNYVNKIVNKIITENSKLKDKYSLTIEGKTILIEVQDVAKKDIDYFISQSNEYISQITPQQKQQALQLYSQYLDAIFPDSKVKDIVYHASKNKFDKFDKSKLGSNTNPNKEFPQFNDSYLGFHFTSNPEYYRNRFEFGSKYEKNLNEYIAILNIQKPKDIADKDEFSQNNIQFIKPEDVKNNDSIIYDYLDTVHYKKGNIYTNNYVVFEPEQIHILGSKQDIEGFKEFVKQPVKQQGQLSLFTEEDFNQKFPNFAELQPFEKKIINDNKDEDLDIQCKL